MAICYSREKLDHEGLDFGLEERVGHVGEERLEIVLDEWHDYEDSASSAHHLTHHSAVLMPF